MHSEHSNFGSTLLFVLTCLCKVLVALPLYLVVLPALIKAFRFNPFVSLSFFYCRRFQQREHITPDWLCSVERTPVCVGLIPPTVLLIVLSARLTCFQHQQLPTPMMYAFDMRARGKFEDYTFESQPGRFGSRPPLGTSEWRQAFAVEDSDMGASDVPTLRRARRHRQGGRYDRGIASTMNDRDSSGSGSGGSSGRGGGSGSIVQTAVSKIKNCLMRLVCIMVFDRHLKVAVKSKLSATRLELDGKVVRANSEFWTNIATDYRDDALHVSE